MKKLRIFLLVLIVIGLSLLATQKFWVPKLVNKIISNDPVFQIDPNISKPSLAPSISPDVSKMDVSKFETDQTCPDGIIPALIKNGTPPAVKLHCAQKDLFKYHDKSARILSVIYKYKLDTDINIPVSIMLTVLPSGEISFDKKYLDLKNTLTSSASIYVLQKFNSLPLKSNFLTLKEEISGPDSSENYCGTFKLEIPFTGLITSCAKLGGPASSTGDFSWDKNISSLETLIRISSDFYSSTYPWEQSESMYGVSTEKRKVVLQSISYDSSGNFWIITFKNGYINSFRFIKIDASNKVSCVNTYGNQGSMCP